MSGHSKWAGIKHKKALVDAKRGKLFSRIAKELTVAAKSGGGKVDANPALRLAISKAKQANMPADNIDRAIKKGTGELPGVTYESITYEGYAPAGIAVLVEVLTDNKNRATAEVRNIFSKKGGNMAGHGSVAWMFKKKGYFLIEKSKTDEDTLMDVVLEAGAEDLKSDGDNFEVTTAVRDFDAVKQALAAKDIETQAAELTMIPTSTIKVGADKAKQVLALVEALEDQDDVQNVYANFDIPDEVLGQI